MNRLKKLFRMAMFVLFIILASIGMGFSMPFNTREKYTDRQITIEVVDKREEDIEEQEFEEAKS